MVGYCGVPPGIIGKVHRGGQERRSGAGAATMTTRLTATNVATNATNVDIPT